MKTASLFKYAIIYRHYMIYNAKMMILVYHIVGLIYSLSQTMIFEMAALKSNELTTNIEQAKASVSKPRDFFRGMFKHH